MRELQLAPSPGLTEAGVLTSAQSSSTRCVLCDSCRVFELSSALQAFYSQCECAVGLGSAVGLPVHYDFVF